MKFNKVFIGIDPGLKGAVAIYKVPEEEYLIHDMPVITSESNSKSKTTVNAHGLSDILRPYEGRQFVTAIVEKVGAMPGQGVTSMFSFGTSYGVVMGVLAALRIPYILAMPTRWKKAMMPDMGKEKSASALRVLQIAPKLSSMITSSRGKVYDGRADAVLLAHYGAYAGLTDYERS